MRSFTAKQAVPVIANECIVRCFYLIRRLFLEVKQKKICSLAELKTLDAKNFLPFNNRTITHMICTQTTAKDDDNEDNSINQHLS